MKDKHEVYIRRRSIYFDIETFAVKGRFMECYMVAACGYWDNLDTQF